MFDNLSMLTTKVNSAWEVKTTQGIILIDTLFGYAPQDAIVDGLKKVGLDPADIKYIIVSHAHFDHDGAVKFVQDTYNRASSWDPRTGSFPPGRPILRVTISRQWMGRR